jgi:hypothetical protein
MKFAIREFSSGASSLSSRGGAAQTFDRDWSSALSPPISQAYREQSNAIKCVCAVKRCRFEKWFPI